LNFPVWRFDDVDVSAVRDPNQAISFFITLPDARVAHNTWKVGSDIRTLLALPEQPSGLLTAPPLAVDARIQTVWPHGGVPADQAELANITALLVQHNTMDAAPPSLGWEPVVRLYRSVNFSVGPMESEGIIGQPRALTENGLSFLVWDFNDVDVGAAMNPSNTIHFWVRVDGVRTYPSVWAHGTSPTIPTPFPDTPASSCR